MLALQVSEILLTLVTFTVPAVPVEEAGLVELPAFAPMLPEVPLLGFAEELDDGLAVAELDAPMLPWFAEACAEPPVAEAWPLMPPWPAADWPAPDWPALADSDAAAVVPVTLTS